MFNININITVIKSASTKSGDRKKKQKKEIGAKEDMNAVTINASKILIIGKILAEIAEKFFLN